MIDFPRGLALALLVLALWMAQAWQVPETPSAFAAGPPAQRTQVEVKTTTDHAPSRPVAKPGELIVRFKPGMAGAKKRAALSSGASLARDLLLPDYSLVRVPVGREEEFARRLEASPDIFSAEPNLMRYAAFVPDDPYYQFQWHFPKKNLPQAWDLSTGAGVTVAVLDTGVAYEDCPAAVCGANYFQAPDFTGTTFVAPRDEINNDSHPNDANGHGTHVASTIAEATNNALGVAGIAHNAQIMPVQVLDSTGQGTVADEVDGITWAVNNGADVINLSLGGSGGDSAERAAIDNAVANGVVVVAAAGNGGDDAVGDPTLACPACYPSTISVGATRFDQQRSYYSNYGNGVDGHTLDFMAPGGDLTVDQNQDGYPDGVLQQTFAHTCGSPTIDYSAFVLCFYQGTSMATPHIASVVALMLSVDPTLTPAEVRAILAGTATDLGPPGYDTGYGYGEVNAAAAVAAVLPDSDGDGCSDLRESQPKSAAASGGGRDPNYFWDFFDTPDVNNVRDKTITVGDIFRLVFRFGATGDPGGDPLSAPPPTGYHTAFDRSPPSPGGNPWNSNAADGAIVANDVLLSVFQFGHTCL